jgi:hypothetical protein
LGSPQYLDSFSERGKWRNIPFEHLEIIEFLRNIALNGQLVIVIHPGSPIAWTHTSSRNNYFKKLL